MQELVDNARNCGTGWNADHVHIWLEHDGTLNVEDNGAGMSAAEVMASCQGMRVAVHTYLACIPA